MTDTRWTLGFVLGGMLMAACGGGGGGGGGGTPGPAPARANLSRAADCDELLETLQADARHKIAVQADTLRAQAWTYTGGGRGEEFPTGTPTPAAASTPSAGAGPPPRDTTDTNVQVPGVDEADVIETDGEHIYLLHGSSLVILRSSPPEATAIAERVTIEGSPLAMFVDSGRALVLSQVYDSGDLGGDDRCDTIGPPLPIFVAVDPPIGGGTPPFAPTCSSPFVKLTLLDLTAGEPRTARELYVEGYYVGARRHGDRVRTIVQRDWGVAPGIPEPWGFILSPLPPASEADMIARVDRWEDEAIAAVDASPLGDWVPSERERVDGALVDLPLPCENAHVTPVGLAQQGTSVIVGLDLRVDDASVSNTLLMGRASQIYASGETLVLAHPEWLVDPTGDGGTHTALHVFALPAESRDTVYRGSGFIPGTLLSQFAIDAKDDVLRIATMEWNGSRDVTHVVTARLEGDALEMLGSTDDIAPGERLFAVRFLGDLAYLVTFMQMDPLFVVDLSDPAHPTILGEVELPGFSEYLHPLGDHHLLTVGRHGVGPFIMGAALKIFDVTDPTAPRVTAELLLPNGGWTPAATNHLAFTFDTRLGLLALPFNGSFDATIGAKLLLIAVDPVAGFEARGEITHGGGNNGPAPCPPPYEFEICPPVPTFVEMQRGLFIDDVVYSISTARVQAHALADLDTPLADVSLP